MILVTGATGNIGAELLRLLLEDHQRVRVLARDPSKLASLAGRAEVVQGDLMKPGGLPAVFAGVEKAFIMVASIEDIPTAAAPIFQAAKTAGVHHVVFLSSGTIHFQPAVAIGNWHLAGEEALKATGMQWTMLRPGNFASNSVRWAGPIQAQGSVFGTHASHVSTVIDPRDIAAVAAKALTQPGHEGRTHTLTGPERVSAKAQVDTLARVLGKPVRFVEVPEAGAKAGMMKSGMPEKLAEGILELTRPGHSHADDLTTTVQDVTGTPARSFEVWARDHVALFQG